MKKTVYLILFISTLILSACEIEFVPNKGTDSFSPYYQNADVNYHSQPIEWDNTLVFDENINLEVSEGLFKAKFCTNEDLYSESACENILTDLNWHEVGVIQKDPYKDWVLLVLHINCNASNCSHALGTYRFAYNKSTEEILYLANNSHPKEKTTQWLNPYLEKADLEFKMEGLNFPKSIKIPEKDAEIHFTQITGSKKLKPHLLEGEILFQSELFGHFFEATLNRDLIYYHHPDGSWGIYKYEPTLGENIIWNH